MTPDDIDNYITVNANICHGRPVFKGTRIMLYLVLEMLAGGETVDEILKAYPQLTHEALEAAFMFAAKTLQAGEQHIEFSKVHGLKTAH